MTEDSNNNKELVYFIRDPQTKERIPVSSYEDFRNMEFFELLRKYKTKARVDAITNN